MKIEDLLLPSHVLRGVGPQPGMDPLTQEDALQEAQLLDVRFDALRLTAGLLFELRLALQLREANTGVLVAHGVRELAWFGPERSTARTAWTVGGSMPSSTNGVLGLRLALWPSPGAQLHLIAESAAFFIGDVPGLGDVPPDYVENDEETVRTSVANWGSPFRPVHAIFYDSTPGI